MKHTTEDAVGTCSKCGRGLCSPCTERFTAIKCEKCLLEDNSTRRKGLRRELIYPAILGVAVTVILLIFYVLYSPKSIGVLEFLQALSGFIATGIIVMCAPAGGRFLASTIQRIRGSSDSLIFFGNPLLLALFSYFYFIFRCLAALALGIVAGPYFIWKATKEVRYIDQMQDSIVKGLI